MHSQKGFGTIEILLLLILIAIVAFAGWYVWDASKKSDESLNNTEKSIIEDNTNKWQTFNANPVKYPPEADGDGFGLAFSFKFPESWKYSPSDTKIIKDGSEVSTSYHQLIPLGRTVSDDNLRFSSHNEPNKTAKQYFDFIISQSGSGTTYKEEPFITKQGYSGLTVDSGSWITTYISNNKGVVEFNYSNATSKYFSTYKQIFDSVKFQQN